MRVDKPLTSSKVVYSDFATNLTAHPDTLQLISVTNENAVKRSIKNIILTDKYERPFQPDLAGNIKKMLFENITPQTTESIKKYITQAIENHEPRAKLIDVQVKPDPARHLYQVGIAFYVIGKTDPVTYTIVLKRIR